MDVIISSVSTRCFTFLVIHLFLYKPKILVIIIIMYAKYMYTTFQRSYIWGIRERCDVIIRQQLIGDVN